MHKQKGFSLIELLIVVAIILIIAAIAIPNIGKARMAANEAAGANTIRTINTAEVTFSTTYTSTGYANSLTVLGPGTATCTTTSTISNTGACLIDSTLGCAAAPCQKGVYGYSLSSSGSAAPYPDYFASGISLTNVGAMKDYCSIPDAVVRYQTTTGSGIASPAACAALKAL